MLYKETYIENDSFDAWSPRLRIFWGEQHDLENMRDRYENLTTGRIIDAIVPCMNGPNRFTAVFEIFLEVGLQFCSNLVDKSFGRRNVN